MKILFAVLSLLWLWVIPATLAAAAIALLVFITGGHWAWYVWIPLSPVLYTCWLVLFLFFCAPGIRRMGKNHPKPRHASVRTDKGLLTVTACMLRRHLVMSLPLVPLLQLTDWGRKLVMQSYSPSIHLGEGVQIAGLVTDPDLTMIGDHTTIGAGTIITAHFWMSSPTGKRDYFTAPIKIGRYVMVGGGTTITPGCTIGDYAFIKPLSYLAPHTEIPAGEIWGGSPATFQGLRHGVPADAGSATRSQGQHA